MPETSPPPAPRRFQAIPVEETRKKVRRFAPEPVETTTRSSKADVTKKDAAGRKHALPIPVETSFKSSRLNKSALSNGAPSSTPQSLPPPDTPKPRRRFAPELIETTKRSKRAGDSRPATLPTDKVDISSRATLHRWLTILDRYHTRCPKHIHSTSKAECSSRSTRPCRQPHPWSYRAVWTTKTGVYASA
jgi:hypothetical protein